MNHSVLKSIAGARALLSPPELPICATPHRGLLRGAVVLVFACTVLLPFRTAAFAQSLTVMQMNAEAEKWEQWQTERTRIQVTGRYEGRSGDNFRLYKLKLLMHPPVLNRLPDRVRAGQQLDVSGYIRRDNSGQYFEVDRLSLGVTDMEELNNKARQAADSDPDQLLRLAASFVESADYYDDEALRERIQDLREQAFNLRRRLSADDAVALWTLAESSAQYAATAADVQAVRFQSILLNWKDPQASLEEVQKLLKNNCEGWDQPVPMDDALQDALRRDAVGAYNTADTAKRRQMHRHLYRDVTRRILETRLSKDGSGGIALAAELSRALPEESERAAAWARREIDTRLAGAGELNRVALQELCALLNANDRPSDVVNAVNKWIDVQRSRFDNPRLDHLLRLADEFLWAGGRFERDDLTARGVQSLKVAWDLAAKDSVEEAKNIENRLKILGFERFKDQWMTPSQIAALPQNDSELAMREGRAVEGMSPAQVRLTLGEPVHIARVVSASAVHEFWSYGARGNGGIVVQFFRKPSQDPSEATVRNVRSVTRR